MTTWFYLCWQSSDRTTQSRSWQRHLLHILKREAENVRFLFSFKKLKCEKKIFNLWYKVVWKMVKISGKSGEKVSGQMWEPSCFPCSIEAQTGKLCSLGWATDWQADRANAVIFAAHCLHCRQGATKIQKSLCVRFPMDHQVHPPQGTWDCPDNWFFSRSTCSLIFHGDL